MSEQNEQVLQTTREYPCGCSATGPGDVPAYCSTHGVHPNVEQANAALDALQQDLDAAVDAEPEFAECFGEVTEIPTDGGTQVWVNVGKATPSTKYKANVGGEIVWAQPIKSLAYDKDLGHYLVLSDGTKHLRPTLHGYNPAVGDYFVQSYKTTLLGDGRTYVEPVESAIVGKTLFETLYTATE